MTASAAIAAFEDALARLGVRVRRGRGAFRGGLARVGAPPEGREVVVLNRLHPPEAQALVLADALRRLPHEQVYLKPAVRCALDDAWAQIDAGAGPDGPDAGTDGAPEG